MNEHHISLTGNGHYSTRKVGNIQGHGYPGDAKTTILQKPLPALVFDRLTKLTRSDFDEWPLRAWYTMVASQLTFVYSGLQSKEFRNSQNCIL